MGDCVFNERGERLFFTGEERRAFIEAAEYERSDKAVTFCSLLHYTGCKLTEALKLTPRQIDCDGRAIVLTPRLRDAPRIVPVPDSLIDLLDKVHGVRSAGSASRADLPIWPWHVNTMTKPVLRVIAAAGISGGPHATPKGIRYGYLVQAIRERIPLTRIRAWMGHSNFDYTASLADDLALHAPELLGSDRAEAERMW
jgi:integrase/recombinase XerD